MMPKLSAVIVIAMALVVQGATLVERNCKNDDVAPVCETSDGSPNMDDCAQAIKQINSNCYQGNKYGSHCKTLVTYGTCKIDVCGRPKSALYAGVNCGGYLQSVLNSCHNSANHLVGGYIRPSNCNVAYGGLGIPPILDQDKFRLQFSKHNP